MFEIQKTPKQYFVVTDRLIFSSWGEFMKKVRKKVDTNFYKRYIFNSTRFGNSVVPTALLCIYILMLNKERLKMILRMLLKFAFRISLVLIED
jgi:hypothetical protein